MSSYDELSDEPIVTTPYLMARSLKRLLLALGYSDGLADVVAVSQTRRTQKYWMATSDFIQHNCSGCRFNPSVDCPIFRPDQASVRPPGVPVSELKAANVTSMETLRHTNCYAREEAANSDTDAG